MLIKQMKYRTIMLMNTNNNQEDPSEHLVLDLKHFKR